MPANHTSHGVIVKTLFLFILLNTLCLFFITLAQAETNPAIKFGVMSLAQPARIHAQWQPFVNYLKTKTGHDIEIVVPRGFKKIKEAIANSEVDLFYINSHVFYRLLKDKKALPIAQMLNLDGRIYSRSDIIVRKDSGIENVQGLKGKKFAYVSPMGAGGYLAPRAYLHKNGVDVSGFEPIFTKNLTTSIHKVLLKETQGATMCGLNFKLMSRKINTGELRAIAISDDYPENLIGARPEVSENIRNEFHDVIVNMQNDPQGREILAGMSGMKVKQFVNYDPEIEHVIEKLLKEAGM